MSVPVVEHAAGDRTRRASGGGGAMAEPAVEQGAWQTSPAPAAAEATAVEQPAAAEVAAEMRRMSVTILTSPVSYACWMFPDCSLHSRLLAQLFKTFPSLWLTCREL